MNSIWPPNFAVPLTLEMHRLAQSFYQHHAQPQKAKQVYLNTLSVYAVHFYLRCLGIETDLQRSQSWNPALQVLADTADLWVDQKGRLECRPVLPGMQDCVLPIETWGDRLGYLVVQLNTELTEAVILGFVPPIEAETIALQDLRPLSEFPQFLNQVQQEVAARGPIVLRHWLTQWAEVGWETLESIQRSLQGPSELAYSFRQAFSDAIHAIDSSEGIKRGKRLSLNDVANGQLLLLVGIVPLANSSEFQMSVELLPLGGQRYLPRSLHLTILDEAEQVVLQADGSNSEGLEFKFSGEMGERFTVQIHWQTTYLEEEFEI